MKKELQYDGVTVVLDNGAKYLDQKRIFLLNCIQLYGNLSDRELKIVFFNGEGDETGVSFFFKK
jgi:hypothetical protein